ncbi:MAG: 30S ribosomal protein S12 methylthiotransferase RimO [candidate division WOR-3 bacterium]
MGSGRGRAAVVALGCPKNRVDSEYILGALAQSGYELTSSLNDAELIVLTTCAFLGSAVKESQEKIRELVRLKRQNPKMRLIVAGCLVARYGKGLKERYPLVDNWVGLNQLNEIPQMVDPCCQEQPPARVISTPSHYAYIKIADGCDNHCSYCLIPRIRGPFRSRRIEEIVLEAEALADLGVKELVLIAQDTSNYGKDIYGRPCLGRLIDRLSQIKGIRWLRLMYAYPKHLGEDVIEQFGSNPKLCRYIDLPIQHIADKILERMNRHYRRRDVERLLERLKMIPEMHIRTTIITGFPGEGEREFQELFDFIKRVQFDRLAGYEFSREPETKAGRMRGQVVPELRRERLQAIMRAQAEISRAKLGSLIGRRLLVLADFPNEGRTEWDAPEIDGRVVIKERVKPGGFVRLLIKDATVHDLVA